ncbi:hypothetical protein CspHIS471_0107920 [Cutaneotrichosporon sp. HIS471]|nr:hypothetical protein CspHIS471_0107920 [Cutaneotrichosporon sp. HIS471]
MLFYALVLALGLIPSTFAQFVPGCEAQCTPVETYLSNCGSLPFAEGRACVTAVCTATSLDECIACAVTATSTPPAQYYSIFNCPVPTATTSSAEPIPTCTGKSKGKSHGKGKGKGKGHDNHDDNVEDEGTD